MLYREPSGLVNLEGHHSGPSSNDHSSSILMQYRSPHDRSNLDHSEALQNSQNLTVRGIPKFTAIAACDGRGTIGKEGKLPWHCVEDLAHFYRTTHGQVMVMGYRTFLSLPSHAFHERTCLVFTKTHAVNGAIAIRSLEELARYYQDHRGLLKKTNFIIGGESMFNLFFSQNLVEAALLTHLSKEYEGDAYFPLHYLDNWRQKVLRVEPEFSIILYTNRF